MKVSRVGLGYPAVSFALVAAGIVAVSASSAGHKGPLIAGAAAAWLVQLPAYWVLVDRLERRLDATRPWLAGMAARVGGFALLAVLSWVSSLPVGPAATSYALALIALLILEAAWLAGRRPPAESRRASRGGRAAPGLSGPVEPSD